MEVDQLVKKEGISPNKEDTSAQSQPFPDFSEKLSKSTLLELSLDFVFFNHGAIVLFSGCPNDPVRRWCALNEEKLQGPVFVLLSDFPLFSGLENSQTQIWNSLLVACPKQNWLDLRNYLDSESVMVRDRKIFIQPLAQQDVPCVDYLALRKSVSLPSQIPMIDIQLYGLDSNLVCMHFQPAFNPPLDTIKLKLDKPIPDTVKLANAIFSDHEKPYEVIGK